MAKVRKGDSESSISASPDPVDIPLKIFQDRTLSVLETVVEFLKDRKDMTYHEIAELIDRDDRTVWTCYNRAQKKRNR